MKCIIEVHPTFDDVELVSNKLKHSLDMYINNHLVTVEGTKVFTDTETKVMVRHLVEVIIKELGMTISVLTEDPKTGKYLKKFPWEY